MGTFSATRTVTGYPCCNLKIVNTKCPAFFSQKTIPARSRKTLQTQMGISRKTLRLKIFGNCSCMFTCICKVVYLVLRGTQLSNLYQNLKNLGKNSPDTSSKDSYFPFNNLLLRPLKMGKNFVFG